MKKVGRRMRPLDRIGRYIRGKSIQFMIGISFTLVAVGSMVAMGLLLYSQFAGTMGRTIVQENQQLINQIALNINNYNGRMREISDTMTYNVVKKIDLNEQDIHREMSLIHEANKEVLTSIACYDERGELIAAAPNANPKQNVDVTEQKWFVDANSVIENPHFSTPHVQNLFADSSARHDWVISLSQAVELTRGGTTSRGVVVVDMSYNGIEVIFQQMEAGATGYSYLIDPSGEIIYHPKQKLIYSDLFEENNRQAARYSDGVHAETFNGADRQVIVRSLSYTGWKVVSVIPDSEFAVSFSQLRLFMVAVIGLAIFIIIIVNAFVSSRVANPIQKLERSVKELEKGQLALDVYIGGPYEIEHLGKTIQATVNRMRELMDEIVAEQENKRRSEFDALQAQINPHFLYNTLDSIVWMIESERYSEAISMVTALASLFRISLSKGQNVITIRTELQHARHYLHIQNIRYKNKFSVSYDVDESILDYSTIKLVVQPLLENAIYHAMEMMDGDGELHIRGYRDGADIYIEVADNGLGMTEEKVASLLADSPEDSGVERKGSGIGLKNVHQRIRLYYGEAYGLEIRSELDEGTTIRIHLPAVAVEPAKRGVISAEESPRQAGDIAGEEAR